MKKILIIVLFSTLFFSCKKEDNQNNTIGTYAESGSAIVVNEGNYGSNNGSVSFVDRNGLVTNYIYENANSGINLGDVIQSYTRIGNKGIICVNNSFKIEIVDAKIIGAEESQRRCQSISPAFQQIIRCICR